MRHICLVTFHDPYAKGCQILSAIIENAGGKCTFLNICEHKGEEITSFDPSGDLYLSFGGGRMFRNLDVITDDDLNLAVEFIRSLDPDIVAMSTRSFAMNHAENLARKLKVDGGKRYTVIAGGHGPSLEPERAIEWADWVCFGEGDLPIQDAINGVFSSNFHNKDEPLTSVYPPLNSKDLEKQPLPDSHGHNRFQVESGEVLWVPPPKHPSILASRGCPMNCSYCMGGAYRQLYRDYTSYAFPKHRIRSVDSVIQEIKQYPKGYSLVTFVDEIFPWQEAWIEEFTKQYKREIGVGFFAHIRPEFHKMAQVEQLIEGGLNESAIGLQTASERILKDIYNRSLKPDQAMKLAKTLKSHNVLFPYELLIDNPYETKEDYRATLEWLWAAPYAGAAVMFLKPFPNSVLDEMIKRDKPPSTNKVEQIWYGFILSIAAMGKWQRKASKLIYYLRLFKRCPGILIYLYSKLFHWRHG